MNIRQAAPADADAIYTLVKTAFETAQVKDGTEQDFVLKLRAGSGFLPDLELVAEEDGRLCGHIMFTRQRVDTQTGPWEGLLLAPLCVELSQRGQGLGGRLIQEGFRRAREKGWGAVFLVGNPAYYKRVGFRVSADYGIRNTNGIEDRYVQACELSPGALAGRAGTLELAE